MKLRMWWEEGKGQEGEKCENRKAKTITHTRKCLNDTAVFFFYEEKIFHGKSRKGFHGYLLFSSAFFLSWIMQMKSADNYSQ